jgi:hypothetical protein
MRASALASCYHFSTCYYGLISPYFHHSVGSTYREFTTGAPQPSTAPEARKVSSKLRTAMTEKAIYLAVTF